MGGWYRLDYQAVLRLGEMIDAACCETGETQLRARRATVILYCWHKMQSGGKPCPYFQVGMRTVANDCGVSRDSVRYLFQRLEEDGWLVDLGEVKNKGGKYRRRTFWWVAEEAGINPATQDEGGRKSQQTTPHPWGVPPHKTAGREGVGSPHQSTEYSESAVGTAHSADAEDGPLYSAPVDHPSHSELSDAWYAENGIEHNVSIPPRPDGDD